MNVERAQPGDLQAISALLTAARLPLDGAELAFQAGVVARDGPEIIGAAALEFYGQAALLRSVVVSPELRGNGVGRGLVAAAEVLARLADVTTLYLCPARS